MIFILASTTELTHSPTRKAVKEAATIRHELEKTVSQRLDGSPRRGRGKGQDDPGHDGGENTGLRIRPRSLSAIGHSRKPP